MENQEHVRKEDVRINVDAVVTKLASMISKDDLCRSSKCCIFKVPRILLRHNPKAYTPNAFSIGPFHYGQEHLRDTQNIKLKYLYDLVSRFVDQGTSTTEKKLILMDLTEAISEIWEEARECYAGPINMSKDEFVQMLVLDGCFLIELFYRYKESEEGNLRSEDDPIFSVNTVIQVLHHDLILLENQIPWVVLACLYEYLITKQVINQLPLDLLVFTFFSGTFSRKAGLLQDEDPMLQSILDFMEHKPKHILDLLRKSMVGVKKDNHNNNNNNNINWQQLPSAAILREAGIKFKATIKASLLDIQFRKRVLEIPPLHIHETTESLFRNLICFEQCLPNCEGKITSYAILLDNLINTSKDMEILCKSGVVDNWLSNEEATEFFNQLYNDTFVNYFHYNQLIEDVNEHCGHRWPRYRRVLMHDYFKHPWALTSVFAAAILLILTFLQTLFTILYK